MVYMASSYPMAEILILEEITSWGARKDYVWLQTLPSLWLYELDGNRHPNSTVLRQCQDVYI